ncbi:MAG: hypothetical protein HRU11_01080 [Parvularculaceae bacterium]|nr:hypothetical protein [Parvularculaceae bacterium]
MIIRLTVVALAATSLASCSMTASKQVETAAFEACKGKRGDAFDRCIATERDYARQNQNDRNQECIEDIARQEDRAAMIDGRRAPDPQSIPAQGC